jgi:hypothetical protein
LSTGESGTTMVGDGGVVVNGEAFFGGEVEASCGVVGACGVATLVWVDGGVCL